MDAPAVERGSRLPLVGWRAWWLHDGRLHSWNLNYVWPAGTVEAECRLGGPRESARPPRHQAPGAYCHCGLWALWTLSTCLERARRERLLMAPGYFPVVGVISAWGEVAIHGREGFRAQYAQVSCLLSDTLWDPVFDRFSNRRSMVLRALRHLVPGTSQRRLEALSLAARRYGVPVLSLEQALKVGLLGELGARVG